MTLPLGPLRPLTEQELLERRELARLRHMARELEGKAEQAAKEKEDNGKGNVTITKSYIAFKLRSHPAK